ncbi:MAG: dockerin type I domain-containing protein [Archaeoglobaceae archaeon]|nr:dockerin type I domain-containing protein [Archaeoglobaceae archaeon]MDW8118857.1 dockerin type I domain-containing protein [Archaeoglobaceae archaeon]
MRASAIKGDCNSDGRITSLYDLIALKMSVGKIQPNSTADMNSDGSITSFDAFKILMLATGDEEEIFFLLEETLRSYDIGKFLDKERMNWVITKEDGSKIKLGVVVENKKLKDFSKGEITNPSLTAYASEETVRMLLASKSQEELKKALKNGEIKLEDVGIVNQLRIGFMGFMMRFI